MSRGGEFERAECEPGPGEKCRGCNEAVYDTHRFVNHQRGTITCGWCGYNHFTDKHGGLEPA